MQKEFWKPIKGYEGNYEVSSKGRVKSVGRFVQYRENHKGFRPERILKPRTPKDKYPYYVFSVNKKRKTVKQHRLVAENFILNPKKKKYVNHINGIKTDNRVENLEWCTAKENVNHAIKTGLRNGVKGEKSHYCKLKKEQVLKIKNLIKETDFSQKKIGKMFGVSQSQIYRIKTGKNWSHL